MSTNKDLFKEAIADAKQVREAALANAKAALEEALAPKLQSMISAKLQEMDSEDDEKLEEVDYISANDRSNDSDMIRKRAIDAGQMSEGEDLEEDFDLSEILAELDSEESLEEAKDEEKEEMINNITPLCDSNNDIIQEDPKNGEYVDFISNKTHIKEIIDGIHFKRCGVLKIAQGKLKFYNNLSLLSSLMTCLSDKFNVLDEKTQLNYVKSLKLYIYNTFTKTFYDFQNYKISCIYLQKI